MSDRESHTSELADLRAELEEREARIRELEAEVERMADRFSRALRTASAASDPDATGWGDDERDGPDADGASLADHPPLANVEPWPDPLADDDARTDTAAGSEAAGENADVDAGGRAGDAGEDGGGGTGDAATRAGGTRGTGDDGTPPGDDPSGGDGETGPAVDDRGVSEAAVRASVEGTADGNAEGETPPAALGTRIGTRAALVEEVTDRIAALGDVTRGMLRHYRAEGPSGAVDAHLAAGGDADREVAYSRNRELRQEGLVAHARRGEYAYAVPDLVREEHGHRLREDDLDAAVRAIEESFVDRETLEAEDDADDGSSPVGEGEERDVEFVAEGGEGGPAFRENDAELVDPIDLDDPTDGSGEERQSEDADAGTAAGEGDEDDAVRMEETTAPSDGLRDRSEESRDAEFVG